MLNYLKLSEIQSERLIMNQIIQFKDKKFKIQSKKFKTKPSIIKFPKNNPINKIMKNNNKQRFNQLKIKF
jgi:hypothetical protein